MSNSQEPANYASDAAARIPVKYQVVTQNKFEVTVLNDLCWQLYPGQILIFDNGVKGIVVRVNTEEALVRLRQDYAVTYGLSYSWLSFNPSPMLRLLAPSEDIGELFVICEQTLTRRPGFVGWTLFKNGVPIAIGNDLVRRDTCVVDGEGTWKPGDYKLEARSFLEEGLQPLRFSAVNWKILSETSRLSAGVLGEALPPLVLV